MTSVWAAGATSTGRPVAPGMHGTGTNRSGDGGGSGGMEDMQDMPGMHGSDG
ncbi:hypothetical protein GCM10010383_37580 [Streptomyces lomondensis]|uniref:Uncharacterized protein n=1 Tax=Streptomyces lomondensis TaxID=68229 RepID=A0ABQ2X883_9ACTN|nr:hypothetical protein GCM10010383_37580 [Streptomyces lomondensis]